MKVSLDLVLDLVKVIGIATTVGIVIALWIRSKAWTGPVQAGLIHALQGQIDLTRRDLAGLDRSLKDWRQDYIDSEQRIWKQLRTVEGSDPGTLAEDLDVVKRGLRDLEGQVRLMSENLAKMAGDLSNLPCYVQALTRGSGGEGGDPEPGA